MKKVVITGAILGWMLIWAVVPLMISPIQPLAQAVKIGGLVTVGIFILRLLATVGMPGDPPAIPFSKKDLAIWPLVLLLLLAPILSVSLAGGYQYLPPAPSVTIVAVPEDVIEITSQWKGGEFTSGYRISTNQCVIVTNEAALINQDEAAFGGPGMVEHAVVQTFRPVYQAAKKAHQQARPMTFLGAWLTEDGQLIKWQTKPVMVLYSAQTDQRRLIVDRNPWHN